MSYILAIFKSAAAFFARNISSIVLLIEWMIATLTVCYSYLKGKETIDIEEAIVIRREST